jgi:hypothetical protein
MGSEINCVLNAVFMAVVLNVVLSCVLSRFATEDEIDPPGCPSKLPLKSQFMHMMVHHKKVMVMSSMIVGLVTGLAVYLGYTLCPVTKLRKML